MPPVLHGQAEARGHGWPGGAVPAPPRKGRRPSRRRVRSSDSRERAHRRAGRTRGRHDARPLGVVGRRPQARRRDRRGQPAHLVVPAAPPLGPDSDRPRRLRPRRVPLHRVPRARHLGKLRGPGGKRGRRGADGALARPAHLRVRHRDRLRAPALQGLARPHHELAPDRVDRRVRRRRGPRAGDDLHPLHRRGRLSARPEARLPVPRRRAQGDQRLRGGTPARAQDRAGAEPPPRPLRHRLPALRHGDRDLRLRLLRAARLGWAHRLAHPPPPGHRGPRLRGDPLRREAPAASRPADDPRARALAPAPDDAGAHARPGRGLDPRAPRGAPPRGPAHAGGAQGRGHGLGGAGAPRRRGYPETVVASTIETLVEELERSYADAQERMNDRDLYSDRNAAADAGRRLKELEAPYKLAVEWREASGDLDAARELGDSDLVAEYYAEVQRLEEELKLALVERDPNDAKDVVVEIRQGAGGDEAALWAGDLFRMLTRYAERRGFKWEILGSGPNEGGGYKDVTFAVKGDGAYSVFKWEGGTHRVQRVPETESQGRIHTSTATVAVMPEAEEVEVDVDANDLKIDVYRPTGTVVAMQDEKSQLQNKQKALRVLRARLYELQREKQQADLDATRRSQIGSGERAEKIRTYNFPENRVTDHRIKLTVHQLDRVLEGELDEFSEALAAEERRLALDAAGV